MPYIDYTKKCLFRQNIFRSFLSYIVTFSHVSHSYSALLRRHCFCTTRFRKPCRRRWITRPSLTEKP